MPGSLTMRDHDSLNGNLVLLMIYPFWLRGLRLDLGMICQQLGFGIYYHRLFEYPFYHYVLCILPAKLHNMDYLSIPVSNYPFQSQWLRRSRPRRHPDYSSTTTLQMHW